MIRFLFAAAAVSLMAGCSVDRGTAETRNKAVISADASDLSPETFALGTDVTSDGAIPRDAAGVAFRRGGEIFLSVDVTGASTDQKIEVQWVDAEGRVVSRQTKSVPEGARYAVFSSGRTARWTSGEHRAVVVINGRLVSERQFAIM